MSYRQGEQAQELVNKLSKFRPIKDGWPDTELLNGKWDEIKQYAKSYAYAEEENFTQPANFPFSVYGHPAAVFYRKNSFWEALLPWGVSINWLNWPYNNSNTFVISALDSAGLGSEFIDSKEFPGNRAPVKIPGKFEVSTLAPIP